LSDAEVKACGILAVITVFDENRDRLEDESGRFQFPLSIRNGEDE
jgi:hypothetical protein